MISRVKKIPLRENLSLIVRSKGLILINVDRYLLEKYPKPFIDL